MMIIHDKRIPEQYIELLKKKLPGVVFLPFRPSRHEDGEVYDSILCHPDIYIFQIDNKTFVHAPCVPEKILQTLKDQQISLIKGASNPGVLYPQTVLYNAVRVGNTVFCNAQYIDRVVLEEIEKRKLKLVKVSQGYARCSVMVVGENAIITQDEGIAETARNAGIEVLVVSARTIVLPGEKHGFIGGVCGISPKGMIIFLGDFKLHKQAQKIEDFLFEHSVMYISAEGLPLYDGGGLLIA
ncbi:MAG: hypothetical protein KJ864_02605 [Candidatus Omnitrophica bacterium]|nr:hypothetical protein [Candidatus Omnitrophota bacterium]